MTLALATDRSGDPARAATLADAARAGAVAAGDDWAVAAASLIRAQTAAVAGDVDTVAAMATTVTAHSEAIGYEPFQVPGMLLHGCVAAHRNDRSAAEEAYRRTLDLSDRTGFADHAAFALARLGATALAAGDPHLAEQLLRQALAAADAARAPWVAAHSRVELGRALAAIGDAATAERLYRTSSTGRPSHDRTGRARHCSSPSRAIRRPARSSASPTLPPGAATRTRRATCVSAPGSRSPDDPSRAAATWLGVAEARQPPARPFVHR